MKILDQKDAIYRILVKTAIHRVSCLNQTVLTLNRLDANTARLS